MENSTYIVITRYISAFSNPIQLKLGDKVIITDKQTEWKGWVWVQTQNDNFGWIAESFIDRTGNLGIVSVSFYDATELSVEPGERLKLIQKESCWLYCQTEKGKIGWIPEKHASLVG